MYHKINNQQEYQQKIIYNICVCVLMHTDI